MASRALTARFINTCPNWPGSTFTLLTAGSRTAVSRTSSPISRRKNFSVSRTTSFRSSTFGSSTVLRLNASNCRVSEAARSPASLMALTDTRIGSLDPSVASRISL